MKLSPQYVAGFIDGEGWIGIAKGAGMMAGGKSRHSPECRISNTCRPILEALCHRYGTGSHLRLLRNSTGRREVWQAKFYGAALRRLLKEIRPHLVVKGNVADAVQDCLDSMSSSKKKLPDSVYAYRESCYQLCRTINSYCPNKPYVPTEAGLPILEAGNRPAPRN